MVADALFVVSAALVAVTVTFPVAFGATRFAVVLLVLLNDAPPDALQVTPAAPTSFCTEAVKETVCPVTAPPRTGVSATLTAGGGGGMYFEPQPASKKKQQAAKITVQRDRKDARIPRVRFMIGSSSRRSTRDIEISSHEVKGMQALSLDYDASVRKGIPGLRIGINPY